jgi:hypothetical protein
LSDYFKKDWKGFLTTRSNVAISFLAAQFCRLVSSAYFHQRGFAASDTSWEGVGPRNCRAVSKAGLTFHDVTKPSESLVVPGLEVWQRPYFGTRPHSCLPMKWNISSEVLEMKKDGCCKNSSMDYTKPIKMC